MFRRDGPSSPTLPSYSPRDDRLPLTGKPEATSDPHTFAHSADPVVQVTTETVITKQTTTTIYSPRSSPAPSPAKAPPHSPRLPNASERDITPRTASESQASVNSRTVSLPRLDKELPRLPPHLVDEESLDRPSSSASVTFPGSSRPDPYSTASLARAALRLGSPALGFFFEGSLSQSPTTDGPGTPASSSTFTLSSSPEPSPILNGPSSYDVR